LIHRGVYLRALRVHKSSMSQVPRMNIHQLLLCADALLLIFCTSQLLSLFLLWLWKEPLWYSVKSVLHFLSEWNEADDDKILDLVP